MPKLYGTPGPRAINPTMATSAGLARCSVHAQLLFDRLIAASDDQGRQLGDPAVVWATCMPHLKGANPRAVVRWLGELESEAMILRYESDGRPLIQLVNWWRYQHGQRHIFPSRWSAPRGVADIARGRGEEAQRQLTPSSKDSHSPPLSDLAGDPNATHSGDERDPMGTQSGPLAGAVASSLSTAGATAGATAVGGGSSWKGVAEASVVDVYRSHYGPNVTERKLSWLRALEAKYGAERAIRALGIERAVDPDPRTIAGRMEAGLKEGNRRGLSG